MLLQVSLEAEMSDALLWNEMGNLYLKIGSPENAIAAYIKAIGLDPDSGMPYCNLGHAYFLTGEFGHALFVFRKSIPLMDTPENQALVWNNIGDTYRALKDINNAIQAYRKADDLAMGGSPSQDNNPNQPGNSANLREINKAENIALGKGKMPSDHPKSATKSEPSVENQAIADGFQSVNSGKGCEENYPPSDQPETKPPVSPAPNRKMDHVVTSSPVNNQQRISRPVREEQTPSLPKEKSIIVIPASTEKAEDLPAEGTSLHESDQIGKSVPVIKQEELRSGKSKSHSNIYPCIDNLEEILAKVNIYEKITRVNPTNDRAWDTLGKLYKSLSRYKDAIAAYLKAIEIAPEREVYYYYLGLLYSVEQQHDDAVRAFQIVLRKNPDYILAHSALAGVYHRMGLENKANHHIATALPKMNNESAYNRACFYAICGEKELAFEFLRLALKNNDTTIEWIKSDPDLDPIRTDSRYQELISEKDQPDSENTNENYFSSELEGTHNRLLPVLNRSLAR
jgi:tetratricopeptide (TPR) repeat protein